MKQTADMRRDRIVKLQCKKCGYTFCATLIGEEKPFCPECCNSSDLEVLDEIGYQVG